MKHPVPTPKVAERTLYCSSAKFVEYPPRASLANRNRQLRPCWYGYFKNGTQFGEKTLPF